MHLTSRKTRLSRRASFHKRYCGRSIFFGNALNRGSSWSESNGGYRSILIKSPLTRRSLFRAMRWHQRGPVLEIVEQTRQNSGLIGGVYLSSCRDFTWRRSILQECRCWPIVDQTVDKLGPVRQTETERVVMVVSSAFRAPFHKILSRQIQLFHKSGKS